jgi:hypothetical protein
MLCTVLFGACMVDVSRFFDEGVNVQELKRKIVACRGRFSPNVMDS